MPQPNTRPANAGWQASRDRIRGMRAAGRDFNQTNGGGFPNRVPSLWAQQAGRPGIALNLRNESSGTPAELRTLNQVGHNGQVGRAHVRANVAPSWSPRWSAENVIDPEPDLAREHRVTQPPTRPGERVSVA